MISESYLPLPTRCKKGRLYDNDSRVSSITDLAGTRTFTYNAANQLVSVAYPDSRIIAYEYDANGNRSKITYPSGTMVEYTYDTRNQPLTIKVTKGADVKTFTYTYDADGRRTRLVYPNTLNTNYVYDNADKISSLAIGTTANQTSINYTYDANANRTQRQDIAGTHTYTYDLINQLTDVYQSSVSHGRVRNSVFPPLEFSADGL